jgi:plastocyanin
MMSNNLLSVFLGLVLLVSGCANKSKVVTAPLGAGEKIIEMKASSFDFYPDIIRVRQGDQLILLINNAAGMEHNITIENPGGEVLFTQNIPEGEVVRVEMSLTEVGDYPFYCNKPLHPLLGMKGHLEVEE